jgi:Ca2+-binding EF-hand superfamily protein
LQAVFFWTLLARQISQAFEQQPDLRPELDETQQLEPRRQAGASWPRSPSTTGGQLSPYSFRAAPLSERQRQQIADVFALFDINGGGTIDRDEFRVAAAALGFRSSRGASNKDGSGRSTMMELDHVDEDGELTLEDFTALMTGELTCYDPLDEIRCIFAVLSGKSGGGGPGRGGRDWRITLSSLRAACRRFDVRMSEEELEIIVGAVDSDRSGTIDFEEFARIMRNTAWF